MYTECTVLFSLAQRHFVTATVSQFYLMRLCNSCSIRACFYSIQLLVDVYGDQYNIEVVLVLCLTNVSTFLHPVSLLFKNIKVSYSKTYIVTDQSLNCCLPPPHLLMWKYNSSGKVGQKDEIFLNNCVKQN